MSRTRTSSLAIPRDFRRPLAFAAAAALLLGAGACSENRPFERESAGAQAKLAVPSSLTPPISVQDVNGAPAEWKLSERVAEALRSRDIPASAASRSRSAYVLKGELRQGVERNGRSRVEVAWTLYDGTGRKVGDVTQMAAVPGAAFKSPIEGVVEAMADAAAESIAPLVPSSSVELADGAETGERRANDRARVEERDRVTALGRMRNDTGVSRNLLDPKKRDVKTTARVDTRIDEKGAVTRDRTRSTANDSARTGAAPPANPGGDRNALTAVGRYEGSSVLSRNLLRPSGDVTKPLPTPQPPTRQATIDAEESLSVGPMPASEMRRSPPPSAPPASESDSEPVKSLPAASTSRPAQRADMGLDTDRRPKQLAENSEPPTRNTAAGTQYWIQIGANKDEAVSRAEWAKLRAQGGAIFNNAGNRIQRADLGARGVFYRVQVGPFASAREAGQFCAQLKGRSIDCFLAPPEMARAGDPARVTRPAAKAADRPAEKPKSASVPPASPPVAAVPPKTTPPIAAPPAKAEPVEKPKDTAPKKPDAPAARPETKPPANASAEKPEAPVSTAPGLPGVLD